MIIGSYPSVFQVGHKAIDALFDGPVVVQEKIDGSQFSWMADADGLHMRSKGVEIYPDAIPDLFDGAVATATSLFNAQKLEMGFVYRGEAIKDRRHNVLEYQRVPPGNIVLYDVEVGLQTFLPPDNLAKYATFLGLDHVPTYVEGEVSGIEELRPLLDKESILGGPIEGVVIKNYARFGTDKKILAGKLVRADFLERHADVWGEREQPSKDTIETIIQALRTEARWRKAIQHLREQGVLVNAPQDIGPLLRELDKDLEKEELEFVAGRLLAWAMPKIMRGVKAGFPEWYKGQLLGEGDKTEATP